LTLLACLDARGVLCYLHSASAGAAIEEELTEFVGPIAPLLCRPHLDRAAAAGPPWDWQALVDAVAREIGDLAKEERFKQQALARLRGR
jgi:hypothetical protein